MDLANIFSNFGDDPWANLASVISGGAGLYGAMQGAGTARNVNQGVQSNLNQNNAATQAQIDALNGQIATNRQQAQDMYQRSLGDVTAQNAGLQGNIDTMTSNLNALSDPNSPYMQQARQAIERKDAASGRRSQWGEREVQLAAELADRTSRYAPGLQGAITGARGQISQNNQGLAGLYSAANAPADRNTMAQLQALQQQLLNTREMNTTGRGAANAATNNTTGMVNSALRGLGGLAGLFGGGGGGGGISDYFGGQGSIGSGITGYGAGLGNSYGLGGAGSLYDNGSYGFGAMPAGDYFGGGGLGGTPMDFSGYGSGIGGDVANNIDDWSFWRD
jgi:hypothetical protein